MAMMRAKIYQKTALITGASTGIGKAAALALMKAGYRVIGTSRSAKPDEVRDGIRMIACDVTSDRSVTTAVALADAELGRLDLLVNNAGFGVTGAAEESSIEQVRALFETNVHGVVRMTNAVGLTDHAGAAQRANSQCRFWAWLHSGPLQRLLFSDQACA
jgi:NAD(P)-dependent dehydrogenase (short-subunit alcohol dehydrogenase family)